MNNKPFHLSSLNGTIGRMAWFDSVSNTIEKADAAIFAANVEIARLQAEIERLQGVKARGNKTLIQALSGL